MLSREENQNQGVILSSTSCWKNQGIFKQELAFIIGLAEWSRVLQKTLYQAAERNKQSCGYGKCRKYMVMGSSGDQKNGRFDPLA